MLDARPTRSKGERYVPVTCQSSKTLALAKALFVEYDIEAWAPRIVNNKPKKGEKRVRPALPGFVFIPEQNIDQAKKLSSRLLVPTFNAILLNEKEATCSLHELMLFDTALKDTNIPKAVIDEGLKVGQEIKIKSGPFEGLGGVVTEIYVDVCLMITIKSDKFPAIRLPAAFAG